jgi:PLP dependent protein
MAIDTTEYHLLINELATHNVRLVAVSKTKPPADILALYTIGQRDFGENYVQELVDKQAQLPADIHWHFIGHLQSNKVKYIAPFVHLIHGVDSLKLLKEINKQAVKSNRVIDVLLQMHIAKEETKFGLDEKELEELLLAPDLSALQNVCIRGLMGMASFSDDFDLVRGEFKMLRNIFETKRLHSTGNIKFEILSMGMSADYRIAIEEGSNIVRVGSLLFGARQ